jgi:hypothetical protein
LILVTVIVALAVTWWRQWKLSAELRNAQSELPFVRAALEFERNAREVFRTLDLDDPKHRTALELVANMRGPRFFSSSCRQQIRNHGNRLDLILFHEDRQSSPGLVRSVAVLIRDSHVVDVLFHDSIKYMGLNEAKLEDVNGDGMPKVVFYSASGTDAKSPDVVYKVTDHGFELALSEGQEES